MRIVIVSRSEPLEQMISYIVGRGINIETVGEADDIPESGQIVSQEHPDWLFLLADSRSDMQSQIHEVRGGYHGLNIAAFHEGGEEVEILKASEPGEDHRADAERWETMATSDFVALLTKEPPAAEDSPRLTDKPEHRAK